jgi:Fe2+ or Zn2+ uptake regulation protein
MLILLDLLRARYDHPTAQECYLEMNKKVPGVGRSTVYRHLAKLVHEGLVIEIRVNNGSARFDATTGTHAHFYCTECNSMIDVSDIKITGKWPGKIKESYYIVKGICQDCLQSKN